MVENSVEIEGVGPIWRDPRRNSVKKAVPGVPYGGMATHLVTKTSDFGCLGVPVPASTPLDPVPGTRYQVPGTWYQVPGTWYLVPGTGSKGVLAGTGTPRHPKSDVFVTKWVAIPPYGTPGTAFFTEFRRGSRQIGPTPSISTLFSTTFGPQIAKKSKI